MHEINVPPNRVVLMGMAFTSCMLIALFISDFWQTRARHFQAIELRQWALVTGSDLSLTDSAAPFIVEFARRRLLDVYDPDAEFWGAVPSAFTITLGDRAAELSPPHISRLEIGTLQIRELPRDAEIDEYGRWANRSYCIRLDRCDAASRLISRLTPQASPKSFTIVNCAVNEDDIIALGSIRHIGTLTLVQRGLHREVIAQLARLSNVEHVVIEDIELSIEGVEVLGTLPSVSIYVDDQVLKAWDSKAASNVRHIHVIRAPGWH